MNFETFSCPSDKVLITSHRDTIPHSSILLESPYLHSHESMEESELEDEAKESDRFVVRSHTINFTENYLARPGSDKWPRSRM